jgi:hypothetical protein
MVVPESTGELRKTFVTPLTFIFPIGDLTGTVEYSPTTLTTFTTDITRTIGVRLVNAAHPSDGGSAHRANRHWLFSDDQAGSGNYTYSATFANVAADLVGTYANMSVGFWDGTAWSQIPNINCHTRNGYWCKLSIYSSLRRKSCNGKNSSTSRHNYTLGYQFQESMILMIQANGRLQETQHSLQTFYNLVRVELQQLSMYQRKL